MLILASGSPRRKELLSLLGVDFHIQPAEVDESILENENPGQYVLRLAQSKVLSIHPKVPAPWIVMAADTTVVDAGHILGKPENDLEAAEMLRTLNGRSHQVYTGIAALDSDSGRLTSDLCVTEVQMRRYSEVEIADYVASGDPLDKAGAYAIQNQNFDPVQGISGCYANVVGLPLCHLADMLAKYQVHIPMDITEGCRSSQGYDCRLKESIANLAY
jgi:MAF protein